MQINIPEGAEQLLKSQATQAGFDDVQEYVLAVLLPTSTPSDRTSTPSDRTSDRSFYEAAEASGLIGGGSEYASDLSSNPQHLEGFGI
jgi:hypothetical protein